MDRNQEEYKKQQVRVGFYDIEETIGKGNFAVVKLARHRITKSRVAIKIIDKSRLDEANLKKIYREVQIMKLLRHPNVLKLYQVMETKNMLYIVMEYATKGEMFAHIDKFGKLSEDEARNFFWQIISAVEYCHNRKVVHRDLKTENLLLDENLNIKIADFGFSNYLKEDELLHTFCGSPPYAAPEIFEGKEYDGPAIDIWSLGVVLYVLVCAALPFDGESVHEVRDRVLEGRFRVPYFMSSELEDLIKKILVKNPSQRYTLNQIKGHPWMLKAPVEKRTNLTQQVLNECNINGVNGDLNPQVLTLMKSLSIDIETTKKSVEQNAYDHHSAIYYLLGERLKQHRTSYPEKSNVSTRIRRASCMADQVIVRNNMVQSMINHQQYRLPGSQARNPNAALHYALNELHLGEVKVPQEICSSNIPGCVTEFIPPITTHASYTSRLSHISTHVSSAQQSIETVTEEGCPSEETPSNPPPKNKRRGRRSAVDAMVQMNARRHTVQGPPQFDTLYVPANHPLLHQETTEKPPEGNNEFANRVKIQIVEPTSPVSEQTSVSMNIQPNGIQAPTIPISSIAHKENGFKEGRRASDGVNAPFRHLLHKSENQYLQEYHELQKLLQRSLTPDQIREQQINHNQFIESAFNANPDWKPSPSSSHNELMKTLQSMHLANQEIDVQEQSENNLNGPGPCRRPASYRKISGGVAPIPAHIRKRRTPVLGESPFSSFDSGNGMDD